MEPVLPALQHREPGAGPPDILLHRPAGRHTIFASIEDTNGTIPAVDRVLPHPAQVRPGQGLTEGGFDLAPVPQLLLRHPGPAHHGQDQPLHVQNGRDQQGAGRPVNGQHGKIGPDAVGPEGDRPPAALRPIPGRPDVWCRRPGEQLLSPPLALPVGGQVDGQHLVPLGADHLGKCLRLLLPAHLAVEEQIAPLRGRSI